MFTSHSVFKPCCGSLKRISSPNNVCWTLKPRLDRHDKDNDNWAPIVPLRLCGRGSHHNDSDNDSLMPESRYRWDCSQSDLPGWNDAMKSRNQSALCLRMTSTPKNRFLPRTWRIIMEDITQRLILQVQNKTKHRSTDSIHTRFPAKSRPVCIQWSRAINMCD